MIRIGIVGTGSMAAERAAAFASTEGVSVAAICSRSLEKAEGFGRSLGARCFDSYSAMLRDIDAVLICAPNSVHTELAGEALAAGGHVLVEYPLCTSVEDAERLRASSEKAGRVLMVGNTIIHEAMFRYLMENRPRLGRILSASSRVAFYSDDIGGAWYMDEGKTGPVFAAIHYHHIEYYRRLLGEVDWVTGHDQRISDESRPGQAALVGGALYMGHEGGGTSSVQWYLISKGDGGTPRGLWVTGSESSVTIVSQDAGESLVIWDGGGDGKTDIIRDDWGVSGSCRDFIDAIDGRLDHRARLDSDIETLRTALRASKGLDDRG